MSPFLNIWAQIRLEGRTKRRESESNILLSTGLLLDQKMVQAHRRPILSAVPVRTKPLLHEANVLSRPNRLPIGGCEFTVFLKIEQKLKGSAFVAEVLRLNPKGIWCLSLEFQPQLPWIPSSPQSRTCSPHPRRAATRGTHPPTPR